MDFKQYIELATRTESKIDVIKLDKQRLIILLKSFVAMGNLLDQVKKNVFYGKEINVEDCISQISILSNNICSIASTPNNSPSKIESLNIDPRIFHAVIGIATESSELIESLLKSIETNEVVDDANVKEEIGDLNWYISVLIDSLGGDFDKILETNINKLQARYPDKFTSELAINRNLDVERKILEQ